MGVFQLGDDNTVKWGCIDVDISKRAEGDMTEEVQQQTMKVAKALYAVIGRRFLVEFSGSRGYHVWVFFQEPVQARYALALLDYAVGQVEPIDGVTFEVFPKQTAMKSFGNLVKLPLGIHKKTGNRCLFVDGRFIPHDDQEAALQNLGRLSEAELKTVIEMHNMEVVNSIRIDPEGSTGKPGKTGLPCMNRIMREGLGEGSRDIGMFKLACFLQDRGLPMDMAQEAMLKLNERNEPPMHELDVLQKAESAYVTDYRPYPCGESSLDSYCSSSCRFWNDKLYDRWTKFGRNPAQAVGRISRD